MRKGDLRAITSRKAIGGRDDWRTPTKVLHLVRQVAGDRIAYDPCTDPGNPTGAALFVCPPDDGLSRDWRFGGMTFVNPPYSTAKMWLEKAATEAWTDRDSCIVLIPARTDTKWWHAFAIKARSICFWRGRLRFTVPEGGKDNSATFPSALLYWGSEPTRFKFHFQQVGWCVTP